MVCCEQSQPQAGAVHAAEATLPKETQTSYPKKALFISNTGSHFLHRASLSWAAFPTTLLS